jgi:outer membrane protein assembly factor BamB
MDKMYLFLFFTPRRHLSYCIHESIFATPICSIFIAGLMSTTAASANDWPQLLGPTRNGISGPVDLAPSWSSGGPAVKWKKDVGHGFSGPVVVETKLVLFDRLNDQERVCCYDSATGARNWSYEYPTSYEDDFGFDDGPRATPAISEGRVYTFGAQGVVSCLELKSGRKIWTADLQKQYQARKGFFGLACSPLVDGNALFLNIGGSPGAGIVALDKLTGKLLWKASDDEAGYSSPVAATLEGARYVLSLTRAGLVAVDPADGRIEFQFPWHSRNPMSVNAATPLVFGNEIFLSASYGTGAVLLQWHDHKLTTLWSDDDLLSNHYATSIESAGFLFGIHGRTDPGFRPHPKLRCIELKTKRVCWESESVGAASLIRAGRQLLILTDKGELIMAPANAEAFKPTNRAQIFSGEVRAFPALANGMFYARSKDQLVCVDLRKQ